MAYGAGSEAADAAQNRDMEALRTLVKQHANVNTPQPDGTTALHWAAHWNDLDAVKLLLRRRGECEGRQSLRRDAALRRRGAGERRHDRGTAERGRGSQNSDHQPTVRPC